MTTAEVNDAGPVVIERHTGWWTLWLNQPERRNPLTDAAIEALLSALDDAERDNSVRGITLRGKGGFFCSGGDLKSFQQMTEADHATIVSMSKTAAVLFQRIDTFPKVTIALVEGAAIAGGLGMMCCCDVAIGTCDAKFAFSETKMGITPAQIARFVVARLGAARARWLLLTAARFDGQEAAAVGLLDVVGEDADACEAHEQLLRSNIFQCAPGAVAATKQLLRELVRTPDEAIPDLAAHNFANALLSPEGREGVASFNERRKPYWAGEH